MDVYQLGILYAGISFILPRIGQRGKYFAGIGVYFVYAAVGMLARYAGWHAAWIDAATVWLPLAYYTIVFLILFERIVELMQSIYRSSITDGLTNLYNRRFFMKQLNKYAEQGVKVSMIFCDIDNFQKLNDTEGHQRADPGIEAGGGDHRRGSVRGRPQRPFRRRGACRPDRGQTG
ncbi:diguanylate cyclase [Paenibacillus sp. JTLBN-2024]